MKKCFESYHEMKKIPPQKRIYTINTYKISKKWSYKFLKYIYSKRFKILIVKITYI